MAKQEVIEVVEYVNDADWEGGDIEEVVEIVEQIVIVPKKSYSVVLPYEVGIGDPPPLFLTPKEKAALARELERNKATSSSAPTHSKGPVSPKETPQYIPAASWGGSKPGYYFGTPIGKATGYYLDHYQLKQKLCISNQQQAVKPPAIDSSAAPGSPPEYIPAASWQGSKPGYYFGTPVGKATGYHLDHYQLKQNPSIFKQQEQQQEQQTSAAQQQQTIAPPTPAKPATLQSVSPPPVEGQREQASKRKSKHQSIINQAIMGIADDTDDEFILEEFIEEEIVEEYYESDDDIIEEEFYDEEEYEEYYDDDEYIIEEVIEETEEEAHARAQLEAEIAEIERQIAAAKAEKEQRAAEGGGGEETSKEKAERMAASSRLEACKQMKEKSDFERKAAARAKVLAEREKNWGMKGKKKEKDLASIIASKAKKQQKLVARAKARDAQKKKNPPKTDTAAKTAETSKEAAPVEEETLAEETPRKQLSMAEMLAKKAQQGIKGQEVGKAKASKDVKSAAADDFGDEDLKAEDFLPSSDEEEEEEEEPELTPEEQHQKSLQWEKPSWTQAKLRTTTKGNKIKRGKYISAPITHIPKKINEGLEEEEDDGTPSKGALMKGAIAMVQLPKVKKHHAGLNFTGNGARIRDGRKIEKQINPKIKDKEEVKIWGADPEELKLTPRGLTARKGKNLADDNITQATQLKKYAFEKPDWAKTKPSHLLKTTETGEQLKEGEDIAPVITGASEQKKYAFEKPSWTKKQLKTTEEGKKVKEGASLSAPIVNLNKKTMNVNMEANPAFLKMTDQGEKLMEEGNLEGPITGAPSLAKR